KTSGSTVTKASGSSSKTGFAYRAGLGTQYAINGDFDLDVRYQYEDLGKAKVLNTNLTGFDTVKIRANEFLVGIAYKF
ncbi:MAG: outer membrane beta-barrel protein, partial [Pseudomonadota bacterium]